MITVHDVPFLRTLAPLLRGLEKHLRGWLDARHVYPTPVVARAEVEGLTDDLRRKADALDADHPLLVVMLMGGTGVGKSTLLNALAGGPVAQASFARPTTRDPVVYFHTSVNPERLDPALRLCRLVRHDRIALADKVLVDTPDVDSNDLANRDKLKAILPVADVALYVGSQEKYHDQLVWELFKEQRQRRAFAFVLNKWDRCVRDGTSGVRPDEDLVKDLTAEGFAAPRLFRTNAQSWVDAAESGGTASVPDGEQFAELRAWLEGGLTRMEIEAVKARGVGQLLDHIVAAAERVTPPDLTEEATKVEAAWAVTLTGEARAAAEILVGSLDPHRVEIEQQFNVRGQQRFRGLMAAYLRLTTLRTAWRPFRHAIPLPTRSRPAAPADRDLAEFAHGCARAAGERVLDQRGQALVNRLLVEADHRGFPLTLLNERTAQVPKMDWDERFTRAVVDTLTEVERRYTNPTGAKAYLQAGVQLMANYLPAAAFVATTFLLLWRFFVEDFTPSLFQMFLPVYVTVGVIVLLHVLISFVFPVRWSALRDEFLGKLEGRLDGEYQRAYQPVVKDVAAAVRAEREQVEGLRREAAEVQLWLAARESAARVAELYGRPGGTIPASAPPSSSP